MSIVNRTRAALDTVFKAGLCVPHESGRCVDVIEMDKAGKALVRCELPPGACCISWKLKDVPFGFLDDNAFGNDCTADGALLVCCVDGRWEAHVLECKRTISASEWMKARKQLYSSLVRLAAVAGVMGIEIEHAACYTAYRRDLLAPALSGDPILFKLPIGDIDPNVRRQLEWTHDTLDFAGFQDNVPHYKVQLDEKTGSARRRLEIR